MLKTRVIPCLLLRDEGLVKTQKFKDSKYVGDSINAVKIFNKKEVDELIFIDIDVSKNNGEPNWEIIKDLASECFMPLAYGGGIKSLEQIEYLLKIGVEKVVINHKTLEDPDFIRKAVQYFGSSTIVCAVDIKKNFWGKYLVYDHVKGKLTDIAVIDYVKAIEEMGAGEIFVNNVDREGTYSGFDLDIIKSVTSAVNIPVIVCGGASKLSDISLAANAGASAVAVGSLFIFQGPHRAVLISYPTQKELKEII
ncbi:cyclase [Pedobacter cryoconitis]|uniref:imidazole glycerol-phosphate synthase n=1 Tax=Pedobacter cryoconitis TaxID=188932 RepID=A0A7W9DZ21_9SPHI|nr:AglZ/HisF2 family acetamidino modification protein [Pedobacter cryoconitis]MBB5636593.1 cyclase [Pedobacter cryoconitis]